MTEIHRGLWSQQELRGEQLNQAKEDIAMNSISLQLQITNGSRDYGQIQYYRDQESQIWRHFHSAGRKSQEASSHTQMHPEKKVREDLNYQTFNSEGPLKLLNQQKDSPQHVRGFQNFKRFLLSSLLLFIVRIFHNELELFI